MFFLNFHRILKPNLKEIELPVQPASEYGDEDSCFVAVVKKIGPVWLQVI